MAGVQLPDDRRVDKEQIADELNVAHGDGRVAVKDFQIVDYQFACRSFENVLNEIECAPKMGK
jgi:hypothetical protein